MAWRNEWRLFRKRDEHSGSDVFSLYSPSSTVKIYSNDYWNSDAWDPTSYGREYDFSRPFFEQFAELLRTVPLPARPVISIENSD
jgi:hypothetical protein